MIQNQRQYNVTRGQIARLEAVLSSTREGRGRTDPRVYRAMVAGIRSQISELRKQMREYDRLSGARSLRLESMADIAEMLIKARVARGMTQEDLAEMLSIRQQQIQKYEATGYRSASLRRVQDVMVALDVDVRTSISLRREGDGRAGGRRSSSGDRTSRTRTGGKHKVES
jgi:ribosome-binding protein aMBF1 (putative translation factor)